MFADDWALWHAEHERRRADPHGSLSITGLHWLTGTPSRFPGAPGEWSESVAGVRVALAPGESLTVDGAPRTGVVEFGPVDENGVEAAAGDVTVEVARRGSRFIVRPRDPSVVRYGGTPTFPPSVSWSISGRLVRFAAVREVKVGTVVDGLSDVGEAPGQVEFTIGGLPLALTVFTEGDHLVAFFGDTSPSTYPAGRRLRIPAPDADGAVTLDFNRATNPPCAYTEFATCALPPAENRLPVPIEAGEKIP